MKAIITVEGVFSLLKRGIVGVFHHAGKGHLHRYCDEFAPALAIGSFAYCSINSLMTQKLKGSRVCCA